MADVRWRMTFEQRAKFLDYMTRLSNAEKRQDLETYLELLDEVKSLPGYPVDYNPVEDVIHIEVRHAFVVDQHTGGPH